MNSKPPPRSQSFIQNGPEEIDEILEYENEITEFYNFPDGNESHIVTLDSWIELGDWVYFTIADECRRMEISPQYPTFFFSIEEALKLENEHRKRKRHPSYFDRLNGMMWHPTNQIFLNLDNLLSKSDLRRIIIHELIHKKFPSKKHGKKFEKMVETAYNGSYDVINSRKEEILFWRGDAFGWYCEKVAAIGPYEIMK